MKWHWKAAAILTLVCATHGAVVHAQRAATPAEPAASQPANLSSVIARLAQQGREVPRSPMDDDPADIDPEAKSLCDIGLTLFYESSDKRKREEGIRKVEDAISRDPRMPRAYYAIFIYYTFVTSDLQKAASLLQSGATHNPRSAGIRVHLGNTFSALGQHRDAIRYFYDALKLEPAASAQASVHYNIGNEYQKLGELQRAIAAWRSAIAQDERHFNARRNLVIAYYQTGSASSARMEANRLIELDPSGEHGSWAREALRRM